MTPALTLHLGDFRTGSTALQHWLRRHGAARGIHYPPGHNHAALAQSLPDAAARTHHFTALAADLATVHSPHVVVSSEHFEFARPDHLAEALLRHLPHLTGTLRLIVYIRPHAPAFLARFAESAKIGSFTGPLEGYLDWPQTRTRLSYAPRLARWRTVFGEKLTVRLYDRASLAGGDVVRDLVSFVTGRDPGPIEPGTTEARANPSLGVEALALAGALHAAIGTLPQPAQGARWTLGRHLGRQLEAADIPQTPLRLHRSLALQLAETFAADAAASDAAFFEGTPLATALAAAPQAAIAQPQSLAPADHLGPEALRILGLWGGMLRHGLTAPDGAEALNRLYHE